MHYLHILQLYLSNVIQKSAIHKKTCKSASVGKTMPIGFGSCPITQVQYYSLEV